MKRAVSIMICLVLCGCSGRVHLHDERSGIHGDAEWNDNADTESRIDEDHTDHPEP